VVATILRLSAHVVAELIHGADKAPTAEQRQLLGVTPSEPIRYRKVRLSCGNHVLSEADNWYVPSRLTARASSRPVKLPCQEEKPLLSTAAERATKTRASIAIALAVFRCIPKFFGFLLSCANHIAGLIWNRISVRILVPAKIAAVLNTAPFMRALRPFFRSPDLPP
jgi:hypothetical protein